MVINVAKDTVISCQLVLRNVPELYADRSHWPTAVLWGCSLAIR